MIPKKIHYCWFGGGSKPAEVLNYIEGWKEVMPDFEIIEWNEDNFDVNMMQFTREAYEKKKYAFVSDVARLWALSEEGGLYFDTDIEAVKSFSDLLTEPIIIGYEYKDRIGTGVIGCEKNNQLIAGFLNTYRNKPFINDDGSFNMKPNPFLLSQYAQENDFDFKVYPMEYFCAKDYVTKRIHKTDNSYCVHHFSGMWQPKWKRIILYAWVPFKERFPKLAELIKHE